MPGGPITLICLAFAVWALVAGHAVVAVVVVLALLPLALSYLSLPRMVREFDLRDGVIAFTTHTGRAGIMALDDLVAAQVLGRGDVLVQARLIDVTGSSIIIDRRHPSLGALLARVTRARPDLEISAPGLGERLRHFWDGADPSLRALDADELATTLAASGADPSRDAVPPEAGRVVSTWRLAVPSMLGSLLAAVGLIGYLRGDPPVPAALLGAVGVVLILLAYLPLRRLARTIEVNEELIDATTVLGVRVQLPPSRVARVVRVESRLLLGPSASQLLVAGAGGERLLVVRTRRLAEGFDAIVRLHTVDTPTLRDALAGLAHLE